MSIRTRSIVIFFFFNDTATTEIYTLSLHDALPIYLRVIAPWREWNIRSREDALVYAAAHGVPVDQSPRDLFSRDGNLRSEEHTSELQSRPYLVCRLLLEKKKNS